jgi:hypothetical protein
MAGALAAFIRGVVTARISSAVSRSGPTCIHPHVAVQSEHMFVSGHNRNGVDKKWI